MDKHTTEMIQTLKAALPTWHFDNWTTNAVACYPPNQTPTDAPTQAALNRVAPIHSVCGPLLVVRMIRPCRPEECEQSIRLAAGSVATLRALDVDRVVTDYIGNDDAGQCLRARDIVAYIAQRRPDLAEEADKCAVLHTSKNFWTWA